MAEPRPAGPTRQETANESRLLAARRASQQGEAQPGPSEADEAVASTRQLRTERASDQAAQQNKELRQGITQKAGLQIDRQRIEYTPQTQVGNLTISRGQRVTDREEVGAGARGGFARQQRLENQLNLQRRQDKKPGEGKSGGVSARQAMALAKGSPAGVAANVALKGIAKGGLPVSEIRQTFGRGLVKMCWTNLWLTFGHSIYFIAIIFFISGNSRYAQKYFPKVGEEWFPPEMLSKIPKGVLAPLKFAETVGIAFVLFWVLLLDLVCIGLFAFFLAIIISATNFV